MPNDYVQNELTLSSIIRVGMYLILNLKNDMKMATSRPVYKLAKKFFFARSIVLCSRGVVMCKNSQTQLRLVIVALLEYFFV